MNHLNELKRFRIALNLIIFNNQKIKFNMDRLKVHPSSIISFKDQKLKTLGLNQNQIRKLKNFNKIADQEIQLAQENDIKFVFLDEKKYPELLREIFSPPDYLYIKGEIKTLQKTSLSVVGSRKASNYGLTSVERLLTPLVKSGVVITSGMAYGIDAKAHEVAIQNKGYTIGVNPGGLLNLYPIGNSFFLKKIIDFGCIISEFPLQTVPRPFYFPVRNRIIAGLSKALLVCEASLNSGSLITAGCALNQNRDILALPGPIDAFNSQGTNKLIQSGAKLISSPQDILEEYNIDYQNSDQLKNLQLSEIEKKLLDLINPNSVKGIDYFVENTKLPVPSIISTLIGMRLKGLIKEEQGGYLRIDER